MNATRETFGNIPESSRWAFYALAVIAAGVFAYGVWRRYRLWRQGQPTSLTALLRGRIAELVAALRPGFRRVIVEGLGQKRVTGRGMAGRAHIALFAGFMLLLLGTTLLEIDHIASWVSSRLSFHHGWYYVGYEFVLDIAGLFFLAGCTFFLWRRTRRPASVGHRTTDWFVLGTFIAIGVTGYVVEALRIRWQHPVGIAAHCSPVGLWLAEALPSFDEAHARLAHRVVWWVHALLVFGFFAAIPFTRLFHFIAGPLNLLFARATMGELQPLSMEEVEQSGRVGVSDIRHFTWQQLLSLDACMECGRCEEVCPAFATGKPLSPKRVVQDLKGLMEATAAAGASGLPVRALHGEVIRAETLWACTTCHACVDRCPVRIDPVTLILDLRRHLANDGGLSGTAATALRRMQSCGNPWGLPQDERGAWVDAPVVPTAPTTTERPLAS